MSHPITIQSNSNYNSVKFQVSFEDGNRFFAITVLRYETAEDAENATFEKDNASVVFYERSEITHYIMSNNDQMTAAWTNQNLMCSISGDLSEDELKDMINSIYER